MQNYVKITSKGVVMGSRYLVLQKLPPPNIFRERWKLKISDLAARGPDEKLQN